MKLSKEFNQKIKNNNIYHQVYECLCCGGCANLWPNEHRCSLSTRYRGSEANSRGLNWIMQHLIEDKLTFSSGLVDLVFRCTTCNQCVANCPAGLKPREYIEALRGDLVEEGVAPKTVMDVFENVSKYGNAWGKSKNERSAWAKDLDIKTVSESGDFEYLLFLGDSAYVERNQETIKKLVNVLNRSGVRFAYLGNEEKSSGNEILRMGEAGLFEMLAEHNINLFKKYEISKIIALSPHSYHALKNEYPKIDPDLKVEVIHYTTLIHELLVDGKIKFTKNVNLQAAYHDSCYLGKHNSIYEAPREILRAIPGLELVEMGYSMEKGVCCGGGGGGQWIERGDGMVVENIRFKQAVDMALDVLVTACPICAQQFEAAKEVFPESHVAVKDVIELVYEAL